jgi:hypothetical protein
MVLKPSKLPVEPPITMMFLLAIFPLDTKAVPQVYTYKFLIDTCGAGATK